MVANEIIEKMEQAFNYYEVEFQPEEVRVIPVNNFAGQNVGTAYAVNRGEIPYSRGQIEAYVFIEYHDGETDAVKPDTPNEYSLWTDRLTR